MIIWWQVYIDYNKTVFGFSSKNGIIQSKFPDYKLVGEKLEDCRWWFRNQKAIVVKIAEQIEAI